MITLNFGRGYSFGFNWVVQILGSNYLTKQNIAYVEDINTYPLMVLPKSVVLQAGQDQDHPENHWTGCLQPISHQERSN